MEQSARTEAVDGDLTGPILSRLRQAVALMLWEEQAVRVDSEEPFHLASGNYSPIYVDCRRVISRPSFLRLYTAVAGMLLERRGASFDAVAGGETAGIPYASVLAQALGKPLVYVRKKPKAYGTAARVEGALSGGSTVLLVEDLITDGGSKLGFLDAIAEAGSEVSDALVLFDRQQGGAEKLGERGVRLHAVTDRTTAFAVGGMSGLVSEVARLSTEEYFRDPKAWHVKRGYAFKG
ncbi:MAG: orotate phosphoribosyltransferase [Acidobacteriota bacterium]